MSIIQTEMPQRQPLARILRVAIPLTDGLLEQHFGHCEKFALVDVDLSVKEVKESSEVDAPEHQTGLLPSWLKEHGVDIVIAGGMGTRARTLFEEASIEVLTGAPSEQAISIVRHYLEGALITGPGSCDHSGACHR